jgi:hypothetical protein
MIFQCDCMCFKVHFIESHLDLDDQLPLIGRRGRDRMVVGFITTYAISTYHLSHNVVSSNPTQARCVRDNIM